MAHAPRPPGPLPVGVGRDDLVAEVRRALAPVLRNATALVALSGGPDSTTLAYLAAEARPDLKLVLGHVRHGLRDDAEDVANVQAHATALGLDLQVAQVSVEPDGEGLEAAARDARYASLRTIADDVGARWLLLGHTADDQAETLLLRLARGTGLDGLGGMAPVRWEPRWGDLALVRPLLRIRRADVHRFVTLEGLDAVSDPMNRERAFRRVRAREEVLPRLERLAPDPVGALARLADLARVDARWLDARAAEALAGVVRRYGPGRAVPVEALRGLDPALAGRVVRHLIDAVRGAGHPPSSAHVHAVLGLEPGAAVDLPGVTVTSGGGWLAVVPPEVGAPEPAPLPVPGRTAWTAAGVVVVATAPGDEAEGQLALPMGLPWRPPTVPVPDGALPPGSDRRLGQVALGEVRLGEGLVVRSRRDGDRVTTRAGTRKLQDVFVDAGVPRALRDLVPVVTLDDRVLWVPGVVADAGAAAAGATDPTVHLATILA